VLNTAKHGTAQHWGAAQHATGSTGSAIVVLSRTRLAPFQQVSPLLVPHASQQDFVSPLLLIHNAMASHSWWVSRDVPAVVAAVLLQVRVAGDSKSSDAAFCIGYKPDQR
jgi:hypothetical protein